MALIGSNCGLDMLSSASCCYSLSFVLPPLFIIALAFVLWNRMLIHTPNRIQPLSVDITTYEWIAKDEAVSLIITCTIRYHSRNSPALQGVPRKCHIFGVSLLPGGQAPDTASLGVLISAAFHNIPNNSMHCYLGFPQRYYSDVPSVELPKARYNLRSLSKA